LRFGAELFSLNSIMQRIIGNDDQQKSQLSTSQQI